MRVRLRFSKLGKVRFTSHRDVARIWERALRRAELPVAYTEGFSPRPKLQLRAGPVHRPRVARRVPRRRPRGPTRPPVDVDGLPARLDPVPARRASTCTAAAAVEPGTPSLQQAVTSCTWRHRGAAAPTPTARRAPSSAVLGRRRARRHPGAQGQARSPTTSGPPSCALDVVGPTDAGAELDAELATQPRGRAARRARSPPSAPRPRAEGRVCRTHQWIAASTARGASPSPLAPRRRAPHAEARAS